MDEETPLHIAAAEVRIVVVDVKGKERGREGGKDEARKEMERRRTERRKWQQWCGSADCVLVSLLAGNIFASPVPSSHSLLLSLPSCVQGHLDVVQLLVQSGAAVSATDKAKYTPLHWAAGKGHDKVVVVRLSFRPCALFSPSLLSPVVFMLSPSPSSLPCRLIPFFPLPPSSLSPPPPPRPSSCPVLFHRSCYTTMRT